MHLIVIAKAPIPGRVKTRLCPPCSPEEAASIAEAALADTLEAVRGVIDARPVVALDGPAGAWLPPGTRVIPQRGRGLAARIAAAFDDVGGPSLLIGMDTPHVDASRLARACALLAQPGVDAVLGPALDGGWWALGLRRPDARVFAGVPMSSDRTSHAQRGRLRARGMRVADLVPMRDVDTPTDALAVAASVPGSRFARAVAASPIATGSTIVTIA
ncbi:MAG TPA: TIGR04282 family arsenosugar biosynthesis glycosyltransferase [Actinomycetota bacterium]|nr:TIGR04282 family arsenosugar biosynthesis glycosyltransferase [Actinomycetota bacterium]